MSIIDFLFTVERRGIASGRQITHRQVGHHKNLQIRLLFHVLLVFSVIVFHPAAAQGWMFRADPAHTGAYDDAGCQPIGKAIWSFDTLSAVTSSPAVVDDIAYVGSSDNCVYALNTVNGTKVWSTYTNGAVTSSPAVVGGVVYVGSNDRQVYAFNATTGEKIWSTYTSGEVTSSPAVVGGVVYVGSNDRQVYAFNAATGEKIWSTYTNGEVTSSPAVVGGVVYVGSNDRQVYAFNAATGEKIWSTYTNGEVTSSPAVVDGAVYVGSSDHRIYALGYKIPVPSFNASPVSGPYPLTVTFTDRSSGDITGWHWDFGDGNSSTLTNPAHTYSRPGTYTVNLTVTGPRGTRSLVVPDSIQVTFDFSGTPRSGQSPLTVTFSDTLPADTTSRNWDFGDGHTSTGKNPEHTYTTPGSFTVTLNATGPGWAASCEKKNYIQVNVIPSPNLRWKFREGITSISSPPVIDNGIAYVDGGKILTAVDTRTGTERWLFATSTECSISEIYGGVVYIRAGTNLYALDAQTGRVIWQFNAPDTIGRPARYIGTICFNAGNTIFGIDTTTGREKWHVTKSDPFTEVTIGEGIISGDLYAGSGKTLYAIQTHTGKERWHRDFKDVVGLQPVASNNMVITGTNSGKQGDTLYDCWMFHALGMMDGGELWASGEYRYPVKSLRMVDGMLLFVNNDGWRRSSVRAIDLQTGKEQWHYAPTDDYRDGCDSDYIVSGDRVFSWNVIHYTSDRGPFEPPRRWDNGNLVVLDTKTGKVIWKKNIGEAVVEGTPVIVNDIVYLGLRKTDQGNLMAVSMNGTTLWYTLVGDGDMGAPAFANGVVYAKGSDGYFYAVGNPLSFSAAPAAGPAPLTVAFRDTTPQKTSGWSWSFGDGTTSTEQNPVHTYARPGTYTVTFKASDAAGVVSYQKPDFIKVESNLTFRGITPGYGIRGTTVPVMISGGNMSGDITVTFTRGSRIIPLTNPGIENSTTMRGVITIPGDAPVGLYDLTLTRPSDGSIAKIPAAFTVLQYPPPSITTVDPPSTKAGTLQRFTINGSNFQIGAMVVLSNSGGSKLTPNSEMKDGSEIVLTITFPLNGIGLWNVTITNPDGGTATLPNAIEVVPSNVDSPAPTIISVSPSTGTAGMPLSMSISGSHFTSGISVKLTRGDSVIPVSQVVILKPTQMRATLQLPGNAVPGIYDLVAINRDGLAGVLPGAVTIRNRSSPVLSRITPGTMTAGTTTAFTLIGDRFQRGAVVIFSNTTYGVMMADITGLTDKQVTGSLSIPEGTGTGTWNVMITNPDGGTAWIPNAVTVTTPSGDDGTGPTVKSIRPTSESAGKTVGLIIGGEGFTKGSMVSIRDQVSEITASSVLVMDPTKMFAILKIPANATPGSYDLVVTDSKGRSGTLPCVFSVL